MAGDGGERRDGRAGRSGSGPQNGAVRRGEARRIVVTGSVATDHLSVFPGRFADQLVPDHLDHISLSFLVDTLEIRPGGVAANIAYGLASLGHRPLLVAAVGSDFQEHGRRLRAHGVDTSPVRVSSSLPTARFTCTTDADGNQLASFYPGAMTEASGIDLAALARAHRPGFVLVGADDPRAMLRHTRACRALGLRFAADPSQQLALADGATIRELVDGADHLFTNEYENALLLAKAGWTRADVLGRVGTWITTLGAKGCRIDREGEPGIEVAAVPAATATDPTGVGDAFRAGYLAGLAGGLTAVRAARAGAALATLALASVGPQTYRAGPGRLGELLTTAYGGQEAAAVLAGLPRAYAPSSAPPEPRGARTG
ncbi:carbohydrate kinase family protein [Streptomyces sp. MST-110588]|uniref:carbohydrate kinase family protein n=1 Tax=Streptomyces sp. MST-110588 TaxID=2833628 RepID=UPI001F5CA3A0|nr:carbohydrate kinase family protein [Streptomyces sp. MST-110588]UNO43011.1 carbohydrate kinase family protein [Streptomyces sp. MST-110588]